MPRKTAIYEGWTDAEELASMRPRPDAAENVVYCLRVGRMGRASMRPRPDAAENIRSSTVLTRSVFASMRPRPDAAENMFRLEAVQSVLPALQ